MKAQSQRDNARTTTAIVAIAAALVTFRERC